MHKSNLMKEGMKKEVGQGSTLRLHKDPWLPSIPPRPPMVNPLLDPDSVGFSMLISGNSEEWNLQMVRQVYSEEDTRLMCQVGGVYSSEGYFWMFNHHGNYTVKSGYWVWLHRIKETSKSGEILEPSLNPIFKAVWNAKTIPKIQNFMWRCLSNCLAVSANMFQKRLTPEKQCPRCGLNDETVNHVLFECPFARVVWAESPLAYLFLSSPTGWIYVNFARGLLPNEDRDEEDKERRNIFPWLVWRIWKAINDFCFSNLPDRGRPSCG